MDGQRSENGSCQAADRLSVRAGKGDSRENGRYFQFYDDKMIDTLFAHDPRLEVLRAWHSTSVGPDGDRSTEWINVLSKRRSRQDLRNTGGQDLAGSVRTVESVGYGDELKKLKKKNSKSET